MPVMNLSPAADVAGVRSVSTRMRILERPRSSSGTRRTSMSRSATSGRSLSAPTCRSSIVGYMTRRTSPSCLPAWNHSFPSQSGSVSKSRSTIFPISVRGSSGIPPTSFDTRIVFHAGRISEGLPPSEHRRSAASRSSFARAYAVLPRREASAVRRSAVHRSTSTCVFDIRVTGCARFSKVIFSPAVISPLIQGGAFATQPRGTQAWSAPRWASGGSGGGGPPAGGHGRVDDERDEVVGAVGALDRELEGARERRPSDPDPHGLFRQELVDVRGDALL